MAKRLQLRRGTTSEHGSFTGAAGEVTVDTDKKTVVVHDGSTAGGVPLATHAQVLATNELVEDPSPQLGADLDLNNNDITGTGGIPAGNLTGTIADARMPNLTGAITTVEGAVATTIANDAVDSQHYAAGSIDGEHIANDAVDSQHYAAGSIDNEHLADDAVGTDELANDVVINTSGAITTTGTATFSGDLVPSTPLSNRNMIINGAMQICQRATTTAPTPKGADDNGYYMADRWRLQSGGTTPARYNLIQVNSGLAGLPKAHQVDCTTTASPPGSDDYIILTQRIEGFNLQQVEFGYPTAKPITLSFWAKGTAGTYVVELYDGYNSLAACQQFTVTTSWQRFEATFPARTSGGVVNDASNGLEVNFWLLAGAAFGGGTYAANTWRTHTNINRAVGISNSGAGVAESTSHEFFFTGVQLELGSNATPFEHRSYGDELARCSRYFQKYGEDGATSGLAMALMTTNISTTRIPFNTEMRAAPTGVVIGSGINSSGGSPSNTTWAFYHAGTWRGCSAISINTLTKTSFRLEPTSNDSCTSGGASVFYGGAQTALTFSAEL